MPGLFYLVLPPHGRPLLIHVPETLDTHRQAWLSLYLGQFFFWVPAHQVLFVPSKSVALSPPVWNQPLSPRSSSSLCPCPSLTLLCTASRTFATVVKLVVTVLLFCGSYPLSAPVVGLTCRPSQVCCSQSPRPHRRPLLTHAPIVDKHSKGMSGLGLLWGPWVLHCFTWALWAFFWWVWGVIQHDFASPIVLLGLILCPGHMQYLFCGSNILLSMVVQLLVATLEFS